MKRPAFQFYPADWRKDMALQSCSVAARGLWMDMLCIAHECEPYGHLTVNGKPMTAAQIGRHTGLTERECARLIAELEDAGVVSRTEDGAIFSRRMVRDEDLRNRRAEGGALGAEHGVKGKEFGKLGGNPKKKAEYNEPGKLYAVQRASGGPIKVGITKYLSQRMNGLRKQLGEEIKLLGAFDVLDMGACEAAVHAEFKGRIDGEWVAAEWGEVEEVIRGATHPPLQPPPSSSSSSSSVDTSVVLQSEQGASEPDTTGFVPTTRGLVGQALKRAGIPPAMFDTNDPRITALIEQGATPEEFEALAREAVSRGISKPVGWICTALAGRRAEASKLKLAPAATSKQQARENRNAQVAASLAQRYTTEEHHASE